MLMIGVKPEVERFKYIHTSFDTVFSVAKLSGKLYIRANAGLGTSDPSEELHFFYLKISVE